MSSETEIVNTALSLIGDSRISVHPDTSSKEGRLAETLYPLARDEVLIAPNIEFGPALRRAGPLAAVTDIPTFGWGYGYQIPSDSLRVICLLDGSTSRDTPLEAPWKREGTYILTDETSIYIRYIGQPTAAQTKLFGPGLVLAIAVNLASKLAIPLTHDLKLARELAFQYRQFALLDAVSANQSEGFVPNEKGDQDWTSAGRS